MHSQGICVALGGTNARTATLRNGEIYRFSSDPTPDKPDELFRKMVRQLLLRADDGSEWAVVSVPGPVREADGQYTIGPCVNIGGLDEGYDLNTALGKADPAFNRLIEDGFRIVAVNDGDLAAHAVAERHSKPEERSVGALIVGTGVGFGAAERIAPHASVFRTIKLPLEIGHTVLSPTGMVTLENTISGDAIERTYGISTKDMEATHPVWREVGRYIGMAAFNLGALLGIELIVPTGGVGIGASDHLKPHLEEFMAEFAKQANSTQSLFIPRIAAAPPNEAQIFELYGAVSIARAEFALLPA